MYSSADPDTRRQFIAGLRALADYLAANPAVPVPPHGEEITVHVNSTEEGGRIQVRRAARLLGVAVTDNTRCDGHFYAEKSFGPLAFRVLSIPDTCMARHHALWSYAGSVLPDDQTKQATLDA
jgi:hypothetical protein